MDVILVPFLFTVCYARPLGLSRLVRVAVRVTRDPSMGPSLLDYASGNTSLLLGEVF